MIPNLDFKVVMHSLMLNILARKYKSLFHHTMVDKNEKCRKKNLTNERKNTNKRTYMTHSSMYKFTLIYP